MFAAAPITRDLDARPLTVRVREIPGAEHHDRERRDEFSDYLEVLIQIGRDATADARPVNALEERAASAFR